MLKLTIKSTFLVNSASIFFKNERLLATACSSIFATKYKKLFIYNLFGCSSNRSRNLYFPPSSLLLSQKDARKDNLAINYQQIAHYRRRHFEWPFNWVNRRGGGYDEHLTSENRKFLEDVLADKYTVSPLKEAPWKKGQYNPNSV
jgi:hypothetical protein